MKPGYSDTVVFCGKKNGKIQRERNKKEKTKTKKKFIKVQKKISFYYRLQKNLILKFPKSLVFYALSCQSYDAPEKIV